MWSGVEWSGVPDPPQVFAPGKGRARQGMQLESAVTSGPFAARLTRPRFLSGARSASLVCQCELALHWPDTKTDTNIAFPLWLASCVSAWSGTRPDTETARACTVTRTSVSPPLTEHFASSLALGRQAACVSAWSGTRPDTETRTLRFLSGVIGRLAVCVNDLTLAGH